MVVLMVMMPAEEKHYTADEHEAREYRFTPMTEQMLDTFRLCAHEERNTEQDIRRQLAENEHKPVGQHFATIVDLLIDKPDCRDTRHECAGVENGQ